MEWLTERTPGGVVLRGNTTEELEAAAHEALIKLASYEDTGLTPERVAELAQAERAGRLVVLPEGGDTAALAATIDSTDMIRAWCGGDGGNLLGLLSMLASEVAKKAGTSYGTLLMFMAAHRPIVDMSRENRTGEETP